MRSFYSLIRYCNNSLSNENIVIGLVAITETRLFFKFSDFKIGLINKLNNNNSIDLIKINIKKFSDLLNSKKSENLFFKEHCSDLSEYLERLSIYNNGLLLFDKPVEIFSDLDEILFNKFYIKIVGGDNIQKRHKIEDQIFKDRVVNDFKNILVDKIDIDFTIDNSIVPSLFFDYKLNGIGANGSVYTVKCIDINSNRTIDNIRKDIAELESLNVRLNDFSKSIVKYPNKNCHYLVMDNYKGDNRELLNLFKSIKNQKKSSIPYQLIESTDLRKISKKLISSNIEKFSEVIY